MRWILRNKWISLALVIPLLSLKGDGNPQQAELYNLQKDNDSLMKETLFQESKIRNVEAQSRYKDSIGPKDYTNTKAYEEGMEYFKGVVDPFYFDNNFVYSIVAEE